MVDVAQKMGYSTANSARVKLQRIKTKLNGTTDTIKEPAKKRGAKEMEASDDISNAPENSTPTAKRGKRQADQKPMVESDKE